MLRDSTAAFSKSTTSSSLAVGQSVHRKRLSATGAEPARWLQFILAPAEEAKKPLLAGLSFGSPKL
jgi:hypothetical protein